MKVICLKRNNDNTSFKILPVLGADIYTINDLNKTDETIKDVISRNYRTIIITNEVASFSENIIKKYRRSNDINIIIAPF